jgi:hypothetical protein
MQTCAHNDADTCTHTKTERVCVTAHRAPTMQLMKQLTQDHQGWLPAQLTSDEVHDIDTSSPAERDRHHPGSVRTTDQTTGDVSVDASLATHQALSASVGHDLPYDNNMLLMSPARPVERTHADMMRGLKRPSCTMSKVTDRGANLTLARPRVMQRAVFIAALLIVAVTFPARTSCALLDEPSLVTVTDSELGDTKLTAADAPSAAATALSDGNATQAASGPLSAAPDSPAASAGTNDVTNMQLQYQDDATLTPSVAPIVAGGSDVLDGALSSPSSTSQEDIVGGTTFATAPFAEVDDAVSVAHDAVHDQPVQVASPGFAAAATLGQGGDDVSLPASATAASKVADDASPRLEELVDHKPATASLTLGTDAPSTGEASAAGVSDPTSSAFAEEVTTTITTTTTATTSVTIVDGTTASDASAAELESTPSSAPTLEAHAPTDQRLAAVVSGEPAIDDTVPTAPTVDLSLAATGQPAAPSHTLAPSPMPGASLEDPALVTPAVPLAAAPALVDALADEDSDAAARAAAQMQDEAQPLSALVAQVELCKSLSARPDAACRAAMYDLQLRRTQHRLLTHRRDAMESLKAACGTDAATAASAKCAATRKFHGHWARLDALDAETRFPDFFLRHAVDAVPAVVPTVRLSPPNGVSLDDLASTLALCAQDGCPVSDAHTVPAHVGARHADVAAALKHLRDSLVAPAIATADYRVRLPAAAAAVLSESYALGQQATVSPTLQTTARSMATRWPRVFSAVHAAMHSSPMSLHCLVIPLRGVVLARVVEVEQAAFLYVNATGAVPAVVDVFHPNYFSHPALELLSGYEATVRDGIIRVHVFLASPLRVANRCIAAVLPLSHSPFSCW